jgi:hypothetical protein
MILTKPKNKTTSIRLTPDDRALFQELARRLGARSVGAAVRTIVRETVLVLQERENEPDTFQVASK